jgi:hypothetical protein
MRALKRVELPPELMLKRIISLEQAAEVKGISVDTLKRHYPHIIKDLSERRKGVTVDDAINAKPAP